jgi:hypothetical protein
MPNLYFNYSQNIYDANFLIVRELMESGGKKLLLAEKKS